MKVASTIFLGFFMHTAQAKDACSINHYLNSEDGKEKLAGISERTKGLIISKLEEFGIEEDQVTFKVNLPKKLKDNSAKLELHLKSKSLRAEGSGISLKKEIKDGECGVEIMFHAGHLLNHESGKDFGSLGIVKEWIRLD